MSHRGIPEGTRRQDEHLVGPKGGGPTLSARVEAFVDIKHFSGAVAGDLRRHLIQQISSPVNSTVLARLPGR